MIMNESKARSWFIQFKIEYGSLRLLQIGVNLPLDPDDNLYSIATIATGTNEINVAIRFRLEKNETGKSAKAATAAARIRKLIA
jgi:hypothetical protein